MSIARALGLAALLAMLAGPLDAEAQGRGRGNGRNKGDNGGGPAFCRSGEGHPVHGWQWCRQKGWDRANPGIWDSADRRDRRDDRVVILDPRDRDRDRDDRDRDDREDERRAEPRIRWPF